ncbi:MAG: NAD(P)-dependent oxidoreductase [Chloroflexota bacterium]
MPSDDDGLNATLAPIHPGHAKSYLAATNTPRGIGGCHRLYCGLRRHRIGPCAALGMQVIGVRRHPDRDSDPVQRVYGPQQLPDAMAAADYVIAALPGDAATANMFDRDLFAAMKPGAYFYNVGRGGHRRRT